VRFFNVHLFPFAVAGIFVAPDNCSSPANALSVTRCARATSPVAVPGIFVAFKKASSSADRCHSLSSLYLPLAALGLAAIPNTEVKLICADDTWRVTAWENR